MASFRRILKSLSSFVLQSPRSTIESNTNVVRHYRSSKHTRLVILGATGFGVLYFAKSFVKGNQNLLSFSFPQVAAKEENVKTAIHSPHNRREARFQEFASLEYDGNIFMTPQDFLESVTDQNARPRIGRTKLNKADLDSILKQTPSLSRGSNKLFRSLHDKGVISYTEYLFLLCVLTKPHSGFRIAFNMFDTDGNQIVDKKEFLVIQLVSNAKRNNLTQEIADTTILVHFFGKKGNNALKYQDFHRFMENLQDEIIALEFLEFSKGLNTISEVEFAKILLRYTNLDKSDIDLCIERVRKTFTNEKGISFDEFHKFFQFLNNLDDFTIAMKMYTYSMKSISQEEFQRAVKVCTGYTLGPHVVNTVFQMFDADGDGHLSHKEFISIMKDRLHRGARSHLMQNQNSWDNFKYCVKEKMRAA